MCRPPLHTETPNTSLAFSFFDFPLWGGVCPASTYPSLRTGPPQHSNPLLPQELTPPPGGGPVSKVLANQRVVSPGHTVIGSGLGVCSDWANRSQRNSTLGLRLVFWVSILGRVLLLRLRLLRGVRIVPIAAGSHLVPGDGWPLEKTPF